MAGMSATELLTELEPSMHRITRAEYRALADAGFFDDRRVELLEGVIVEMAAMGRPHILAQAWLTKRFVRGVGEDLSILPQLPLVASEVSEPMPDVTVVAADWPQTQHDDDPPRAAHLIVEVAHSSLRRDLNVKAAIYAGGGFAEYWVVDLVARRIVVHTDPVGRIYRSVVEHTEPAVLRACAVDVDLADLFAYALPASAE